jgi:hypothetical protein
MSITEASQTPLGHDQSVEIIVNTRPHRLQSTEVSYTQVVDIAFPNHPANPNLYFEVTYRNAVSPKRDGTLLEGDVVTVKNGTNFHVTQTDRS